MAIHDVDRTNNDRSEPLPNRHDTKNIDERMAHQTASSHYNPVGPNPSGRLYQIGKSFFANDGTNDRAIFGFNATTNTWGVFGSQTGQDVKTTDPSKYAFSTDYDSFKITEVRTVTLTGGSVTSATNNTFSVTSNFTNTYSSAPIVLPFVVVSGSLLGFWAGAGSTSSGVMIPFAWSVSSTLITITQMVQFLTAITTTGVTFSAIGTNGTSGPMTVPTYTLKYYVLQETAT